MIKVSTVKIDHQAVEEVQEATKVLELLIKMQLMY